MTINSEKLSGNLKSSNSVWKFFTSVKLTVIVLLLLAATSVIGTIIPQNGTEQFYLQKYGDVFFKLFNALDIFDMYNAWWFVLLLILLSINIVVCSIDKLKTTWKIIFPDKITFNIERFRHLKHKEVFELDHNLETIEDKYFEFIKKNFSVAIKEQILAKEKGNNYNNEELDKNEKHNDKRVAIFGERGRWTRFGVYVVHLSILFMLAGGVIGSLWGFKAFVAIPEGATVDSAFLRDNETPVELGFKIRCNSFSVTFYDTGQPEEFKSSLTVIEDDKESFTKDIIVNDPLRYKGLSFYQSSYGIDSAKSALFKITSKESGMTYSQKMEIGQTIDVPESGGKFTLTDFVHGYNFQGHNLGEGFVGKLIEKHSDKHDKVNTDKHDEVNTDKHDEVNNSDDKNHTDEQEIYIPIKFPTFDKMRRGEFSFEIEDYEKKYYTGLQVTKDPGVWYVYLGFIFMIIGCWITFFMSHQTICVEMIKKDKGLNIIVSGSANKNGQGMKLKITDIASKMKQL
ncbi:MAG: cytochrome c biogenesis protein ResB [Desulfamplus sp.]|nr:cytochrome c biogenesis protein ResB [Desulfamplus sp.]